MAVEQGRLQIRLKPAHLSAHRRLAQAQRIAGMGETARFGRQIEDPDLVPIHRRVGMVGGGGGHYSAAC